MMLCLILTILRNSKTPTPINRSYRNSSAQHQPQPPWRQICQRKNRPRPGPPTRMQQRRLTQTRVSKGCSLSQQKDRYTQRKNILRSSGHRRRSITHIWPDPHIRVCSRDVHPTARQQRQSAQIRSHLRLPSICREPCGTGSLAPRAIARSRRHVGQRHWPIRAMYCRRL